METALSKPWRIAIGIGLAILTVYALVLRLQGVGQLGLDHFDEGIYAAAATWSLGPTGLEGIDPWLIPYAPPAYPFLVGLVYFVTGPSDVGAILISILAGAATIPLTAWFAANRFGPVGMIVAAAMAASSGLAFTFSRMALTDALFLATWLLAMIAGARFLERPGFLAAIGLGLAVGVAQLTKYNGWLAGAIVGATAVVGLVVDRTERDRRRAARVFGWGIVAAVVAGAVYLPWFAFVDRHGGYRALLAHQRGYLGSIREWPAHWWTQLVQASTLVGDAAFVLPIGGFGLAVFLVSFINLRRIRAGADRGPLDAALVVGLAAVSLVLAFFAANPGWWLGVVMVVPLIRSASPGVRMVGVWWLVLTILTPLYHPYARLWLPLEACGWIVVAATARRLTAADKASRPGDQRLWLAVAVAILAAVLIPHLASRRAVDGTERDSLRHAIRNVVDLVPKDAPGVILLGRPPLAFYAAPALAARGVASSRAGSVVDLARPTAAWAIVDMTQVGQEGDAAAILAKILARWEVVAEAENSLSPATLLDVDPSAATRPSKARTTKLLLLRPRSREAAP